ncbi:VOC family protein [Cellulomonas cellasea]|uniref:Putative pterin-4-alpha-carbinolamine dehydratase n=1 Tax=Cellulomonas cellasea TaxID=43670 RepID=A0A7W4UBH7_9CELL|nr:VOC family protein [Cellulomonas cellasea]MBB2921147.1 4a-hydroxytetrahydrobiopterin dehydratase [Cellulomonas cellasea]
MTTPRTTLTATEVSAQVDARHWRVLLNRVHAAFRTGSFERGLELVTRIAAVADRLDHHPDVHLTYPRVQVSVLTHDAGGLTAKDVALAAAISAVADELGLDAEVPVLSALEVAIDALDIPAVYPFWRAVLGYVPEELPEADDPSPALLDPAGLGPAVWFQQMDAPRPQRNRIHLDVTVPHDVADERVAAALAAGGHLVSDERAPAFWVLADAEGNEACVCTWQARD